LTTTPDDQTSLPSDEDWHTIDSTSDTECRRIGKYEYQLRNKYFMVTIDKEGFDVYREQDSDVFADWLKDHNIVSVAIRD
jgi:hypothetical protein